ncbi:ComEC/Rec2 family competence protein [Listeria cossartiae subsp. cayugensis]|uniref:ComEC/Rec2 family competence protein n=1 Tax=Listeria cossartiae subsp. cayugensis TaxID=2713505 RepID=A0ABU2IMM9_9LIST|nr:ComEC/Rec2 family competence protein [Listeria cossartiae]MDT0049435.1 ComEC/Rec2 family competence protein [Listeria cossartiae subsp. cayugensis]MDT0065938.1 ComEC/Rec2 family competence protein [Listeria cossartiae subsp. cayugensis]MDT0078458.1 ComEC/Rec2 family competence protein [Listeria cossartiae subsp. cayugensis]MDT0081294.1 ComEC/Rec2 family competence protein [Listeria cossartiae subsp. cayugensis]MDT0088171.1 ComEC/Rec2 family competence protein [Listeria cossartiae subsp. cay
MKKGILNILLVFALITGISLPGSIQAEAAAPTIKVHFIDVGQGDAIYIKAPSGEDILIDAGNKGKGKIVVNYLKKLKVKDIDIMIASHSDADNIGGLPEVMNSIKVKSLYAPNSTNTTAAYKDFVNTAKKKKLTIKTAKAGVKLPVKGVNAQFVGPVKTYGKTDRNNWSAVLHVAYKKNTFLFTGDAQTKAETDMIKAKKTLRADVLKVSTQGSKTATSQAFVNVVKPKYAIISVGKNGYGHPTSQTVSRLTKAKAKVYRTDRNKTIVVTGNGSTYSIGK